jgi:hypothetical protein
MAPMVPIGIISAISGGRQNVTGKLNKNQVESKSVL